MRKTYLSYLILVLFFSSVHHTIFAHEEIRIIQADEDSKEIRRSIKTADRLFRENKFREALKIYLDIDKELDGARLDIKYKIALCYLRTDLEKVKSIEYFTESRDYFFDQGIEEDYFYFLGIAHQSDYKFDEAIIYFDKFLSLAGKKDERKAKVSRRIENCINAKKIMTDKVDVKIQNCGKLVNSSYPDYTPVITADESVMVLNSRRKGSTGGLQNDEGEPDEVNGTYLEDIYVSINVNGNWLKSLSVGSPLNTNWHDAAIGISPDGQKLFVYRTDSVEWGNIFVSNLRGYEWGPLEKLPAPINSEFKESHMSITADGKKIFFSSNRPKGDGTLDFDLYYSEKLASGAWGVPVNLGSKINTRYDEISPFIHPDGNTLYFSSTGHNSMGGYDIFKSTYENGLWSVPKNLGHPINTPENDVDMVISADGKRGYFSSIKKEGYGENDIYVVHFSKASGGVAPDPITMFKGVVKNCDNAFLNAKIDIKNSKTGEQINAITSNSATGKYMLILPKGGTFNIQVDADDYVTQKFQIITVKDEPYKENVIDITLCKENEDNDCDDACVTGDKVDKTTFSPSRLEQDKGEENKELFVKNIKEIDYKEGEFKVKKYVVSYDQYSNDVYMVKRDLTTGSVTYKKNYKPITKTTLNLELDRLNEMILEEGESEVKAGNDILITLKNKFEYIKILENDEAVKGELLPKSVVILEDPQNGTIDYDDETGELEYSPNLGFAGDDKVKYKVCNTNDQCASALVVITVKDPSAVNKAPVLKDDVYEVEQNSIATFNILGNDKDEDGLLNKRTLQISSDLVNAKAKVENDKITYEPYNGFEGESRFNYKVCDNNGACEEASIYVNVKYQSHFNKKDVADEIKELSLFKNSGGNAMDEIDEKISKTSTTDDKGNQTITYYNMYYFFDEYRLRNDAKNEIKGVLKYMNDHPDVNLEIVEHTDNKGAKYYNKILSQKRSDRIKELFVSKGVESQRIKSIGKGESAPIKDCDEQDCNEGDFRANKRIEFTYINYKGSFETRDPNQTKTPKEKLKNPKEVEVSQIELMENMIHFQDILKRRADTYENSIRYRVHVATYKTELPDATNKLADVPGLVVGNDFYGNYIYLSKVYNTPNEANVLARILRRKGFMKSRVVGYINGKRVSMLDIHRALFR